LLWIGKKVLLDKKVMLGKKHAEARMGVVPANNLLLGIVFILNLVNVLPGVLSESDMGSALGGVVTLDAGLNHHPLVLGAADQHPANFGFHRGASVLANLARDFSLHYNYGLRGYPDFYFGRLCHHCDAPIAISPNTCFLSPAIRYATSPSAE